MSGAVEDMDAQQMADAIERTLEDAREKGNGMVVVEPRTAEHLVALLRHEEEA
jgi:hypothetical protein